jgi:hypothetical protein
MENLTEIFNQYWYIFLILTVIIIIPILSYILETIKFIPNLIKLIKGIIMLPINIIFWLFSKPKNKRDEERKKINEEESE